jgi:hypothetical protein
MLWFFSMACMKPLHVTAVTRVQAAVLSECRQLLSRSWAFFCWGWLVIMPHNSRGAQPANLQQGTYINNTCTSLHFNLVWCLQAHFRSQTSQAHQRSSIPLSLIPFKRLL